MREELLEIIGTMYDDEATDAVVYSMMAARSKSPNNREVLMAMSRDEEKHRDIWKQFMNRPAVINRTKVRLYSFLSFIFGLTFTLNLMEKGEDEAKRAYTELGKEVPVALSVLEDEIRHEQALIDMIEERGLSYISSIVLGLNDALVELTGALAGFTLALNDNTMIGLAGFITGVAATLSMAASEYLSKKADPNESHPLRAASYTGFAYMLTVGALLLPYAFFQNPLVALGFCLTNAALVIAGFTYFVSIVRRTSFRSGFLEMIGISFSVALLSFMIGWGARVWLNIDA